MLQSVLQCVLQSVAVCCSVLQCVLQCVWRTCIDIVRCVAVCVAVRAADSSRHCQVCYHGSAESRRILRAHEFDPLSLGVSRLDVLLTSYEVALQDSATISGGYD